MYKSSGLLSRLIVKAILKAYHSRPWLIAGDDDLILVYYPIQRFRTRHGSTWAEALFQYYGKLDS
jgi:hypothetical protein